LRWLLPQPKEQVNLVEAYSEGMDTPRDRPFLRVNMVISVDGASSVGGRSGALGGPGDKLIFTVLRSLADVILVGSGTVRAEHYGPPTLPEQLRTMRQQRGQAPLPRIAVVTRSPGELVRSTRLFAGDTPKPVVIAPATVDPDELRTATEVAHLIRTGKGSVDLGAALKILGEEGAQHVICEGGPFLNATLAASGLVDELCLTLSPRLAGFARGRPPNGWPVNGEPWGRYTRSRLSGLPANQLTELDTVHLLEDEGFLFLRMRSRRSSS